MTISKTRNENELFLTITGRIDSTTSDAFMEYLKQHFTQDVQKLTLDFEDVDFISSKGLRVLVSVYKTLDGRQIEIINANSAVREVFRLSSLLNIFNIK